MEDPTDFVFASLEVVQVLYGGWLPIGSINDGHGHTCILKFDEGIPDIFNKLTFTQTWGTSLPLDAARLGICSQEHFNDIWKYRVAWLAYRDKSKELYGDQWLHHMDGFYDNM